MYSSLHMNAGSSFDALGSSARSSSSVARAIRAEEYSLRNRLRSLHDDREFVAHTRRDFPSLPFFLNLRCGLWYAPPNSSESQLPPSEGCYFKSTDGHAHHWKFSTARLNTNVLLKIIQLADTAAASSSATAAASSPRCTGALIVDSTRKGKRFPDSFSRTIPIWCAVWNRALAEVRRREQGVRNGDAQGAAASSVSAETFPDATSAAASSSAAVEWDTSLHMPLWVSEMESRQIEERLSGFVSVLLSSGVDFAPIARGLKKPLRCLWLDRQSAGSWANGEQDLKDLPFTPIILLQCSRVESETRGIGQRQGWSYIQGAGDDEENWTATAGIKGFAPVHLTDKVMKTALQMDHDEEIVEYLRDVMQQTEHAAASGPVSSEGQLQLYRIPYGTSTILATTTLPTHAAALAGAASSSTPDSLSLLHLYFDSTAELNQQRKAKLAAEAQRAMEKAMRRGEAENQDEDDASDVAIPAVAAPESAVDLLDWPQEASLAVPVSSAAKSRDSLQSILPACLDFIERQASFGRAVVLSCSDLSFISCVCTAAIVARTIGQPAAATPASDVAAATSAAPPAPASATSPSSDKSLLRVTLTTVKSHLPEHFPSRLLLKQLNTYFLSKSFQ